MKQSQIITSFLYFLTLLDNFHKLAGLANTRKVSNYLARDTYRKIKKYCSNVVFYGLYGRKCAKMPPNRTISSTYVLICMYNCLSGSYARYPGQSYQGIRATKCPKIVSKITSTAC